MNSVRLFFVGGLTSYRALFYWLSPTIYIPSLIVAPIFWKRQRRSRMTATWKSW